LKRTADDVIRAALERRSDLYVSISETAESHLEALGLSSDERSRVESLVGDQTVAEVLASKSVDGRMLYELYATGAVLLDNVAVLMLDLEVKPDEPVEISAAPRNADPIRELPKPRSNRKQAPTLDTLESKIDEIAELLGSRDDFGLFGINETSHDVDVRAAYDLLLGHLRLNQIPTEHKDLQKRARELRIRLEQAYQRVRTADTRSAFAGIRKGNRSDRREEREDGSRAVDAESWFRTGEGHLAHKNYDQAIEAFGMAVHLDPDQGDYAACLGYSLYRSQPDNSVIRREALEHVAKGVKLSPGREKPLLFLSRIFRETGDAAMSAKVLRRALLSNPDSPALVQEMCLIKRGGSKAKPKKLLDRLRRR
jgi:Tfp pilus assembly protein PilF